MPDLPGPQSAETKAPADHLPAALAPPGEERVMHGVADHAGLYPSFRQLVSEGGSQEPPGDRVAALLARPEYSHPANNAARARVLSDLQRDFGNAYVQRMTARTPSAAPPVLRQTSGTVPAAHAVIPTSSGSPLDRATQSLMSSRFGHDFSAVRVHDDSASHRAAQALNATAFTTGRDVYFSPGQYTPGSTQGRQLLAHELAHVVQHDTGGTRDARGVSEPGDPLEHEAESMSEAAMRGERYARRSGTAAPAIQRQAAPAPGGPAAPGAGAPGAPPAAAGDFIISFAGMTLPLPLPDVVRRARAGQVSVPPSLLRKIPSGPLKVTEVTLTLDENKTPVSGRISASANIPPVSGSGTLDVDKDGNATGSISAEFSSKKIPGLTDVKVDATVTKDKFALETDIGFAYKNVTGSLHYKYDNGHSGKGKAKYEGAKLKGEGEIILSPEGKASGTAKLEAELFPQLRGTADVTIGEDGNWKIAGKIAFTKQVELFPEKKYEKSFFNFERKFPLWGFTIPVIDVNVGLFAEIHAGAGFRAKFGPGVLRDIEVTGEYGSDPETVTQFGLSGEFFLPAGAEIVLTVGGGIGLGLAVADITGGIEAQGVAGIYAALSVRPQLTYSGGKYTIKGTAELAGVAQLKLGINAFAKVDVGVWLFKGTVWRKDWTLAEWIWNTGLNVALRANVSYTLGEDFAPDFSFETGQVDPEKLIRDVMPESGSPVPAPPKPPAADKSTFNAEGATGGAAAGAAPGEAPAPPTPGAPPAKTAPGTAPAAGGGPGAAAPEAPPKAPPPPPPAAAIPEEERTPEETVEVFDWDVEASQGANLAPAVMRTAAGPGPGGLSKAEARKMAKTHYYNHRSDQWIPRTQKIKLASNEPFELPASKHEHLGRYQGLAGSNNLDTSKGDPRGDQRGKWISAGYPIPRNAKGEDVDQDNQPVANPWQVDHIVELQVGGKDNDSNYQLLDSSANQSSGGTIRGFLARKREEHKVKDISFTAVKPVASGMTGPSMTKEQAKQWQKKYGSKTEE